jgi:ABC-type transport system involved in multi-copper enzyme maturation permease subunit
VTALLRSELLKQRSTFTNLGLFLAMLTVLLMAVLLHALALPPDRLASAPDQVQVFRFGSLLAALFAGLVGALSISAEIRHGTIRPTFLVAPRRGRVIGAKILISALVGIVFGLVAAGAALGVGSIALAARGISIALDGDDYTLVPLGAVAAAALWAPLGLGLAALLRNQVATLVAIFLWLFFIENLLVDFVPGAGKFAPGAAAAAITGLDPDRLLAPASGALLLAGYTAVAATAGWIATVRRDVA